MVALILQISNLSEVLPGALRNWFSLTFTFIECSIDLFLYQNCILEQLPAASITQGCSEDNTEPVR